MLRGVEKREYELMKVMTEESRRSVADFTSI